MSLFDSSKAVRCKKCRLILFSSNEYPLVDCHKKLLGWKPNTASTTSPDVNIGISNYYDEIICETLNDNSMLFLNEESYPSFIEDAINEALWQKGKLYCPKCKIRIGSFNFINISHCSCQSSMLPAVHLHISKVDYILPCEQINPGISVLHSTAAGTTEEKLSTFSNNDRNSVVNLDASRINCSFGMQEPEEAVALMNQIARASEKSDSEAQNEIECNNEELSLEEKFSAIIPDNLVCPVCLDLLYSPFVVKPCSHIFCEPCLRRLAKPSPTNTSCPLCRELIGLCNPCHDIAREIKENYPEQHQERHKFEKLHDSQNLPLPWLRDYRFLGLRGRFRQGHYGRNWTGWRTILWIFILDCLGLSLILAIKWVLRDYEANLQRIDFQSKQRTLDTPSSLELESSYPRSQDFLDINNDSLFENVVE